MYVAIIIFVSLIAIYEFWYIMRLRGVIKYAIETLKRYEAALVMDRFLQEEDIKKGSKK